jgi:hypothetical protein
MMVFKSYLCEEITPWRSPVGKAMTVIYYYCSRQTQLQL